MIKDLCYKRMLRIRINFITVNIIFLKRSVWTNRESSAAPEPSWPPTSSWRPDTARPTTKVQWWSVTATTTCPWPTSFVTPATGKSLPTCSTTSASSSWPIRLRTFPPSFACPATTQTSLSATAWLLVDGVTPAFRTNPFQPFWSLSIWLWSGIQNVRQHWALRWMLISCVLWIARDSPRFVQGIVEVSISQKIYYFKIINTLKYDIANSWIIITITIKCRKLTCLKNLI